MLRFTLQVLLTSSLLGAAAAWSLREPKAFGDDLVQDFLSAGAWLNQRDPYGDLVAMREAAGFPPNGGDPMPVNPHPPLAILLTVPFAGSTFDRALLAVQILQVLALSAAWNGAWCLFTRGGWLPAALGGLLGLWAPVWQGLDWGQPVGIIALFTTVLWYFARAEQPVGCGISFGLACTLRPFFAIVSAASARWTFRRMVIAGCVGGIVAGVGFTVVGTAPWTWYQKASVAGRYTVQCGSLPGVLHLGTTGGIILYAAAWLVLFVACRRGLDVNATVAISLTVGLLTYPLAWFHYDVTLIPVLVWLGVRSREKDSRFGMVMLMLYISMRAVPNLAGISEAQLWLQVAGRVALLAGLIGVTRVRDAASGYKA